MRPAWIPAGILAATALAAWLVPLPDSLAGLRTFGPYALFVAGLALALRFNRGRAFVVVASLLGAFAAQQAWPAPAVQMALTLLLPLNVFIAMLRPERGVRYRASYAWLALLAAEAVLLAWLFKAPGIPLDNFLLRADPTPLLGRIAFAAAFAAAVWRAWPEAAPLQVGAAGALAAWFIAVTWVGSPGAYSAFMAAAGAILVVSLLEESHRLAFRDTLTGLPARRALDERMRGLGELYTIAMVDVDHFKKFNDTHGHDIGDQVLKLVGARLGEVGGGGLAYRYGGEEFALLFPGSDVAEAFPHLEALRASVESYRMAVRAAGRPKSGEEGAKRRAAGEKVVDTTGGVEKSLSVTVSIGACSPGGARRTPAQVIKAADEALYRAKQGGRNRVST